MRLRQGKRDGKKDALREWWENYENFAYPLCLLVSPIVFMVVIGVSNILSLVNGFYVKKLRVLHVLKGFYPVLFQMCFVVFMCTSDNAILTMTTFCCLSVFLLGSTHYLLETAVISVYFAYSFIGQTCSPSNKVSDQQKNSSIQGRRSK